LIPHLLAARHLLPTMKPGSSYLGVGGGMADYVMRGSAPMSVVQSGLRMMYRAIAKESTPTGVHFREVILRSMISGRSNSGSAQSSWLTGIEAGTYICDLIEKPGTTETDAIVYKESPRTPDN
jgi:hypothetical protein